MIALDKIHKEDHFLVMVAEAVFEGPIPSDGMHAVLGGLEELGTTGVLAFQSQAGSGAVKLVQGQIAETPMMGATPDERALELLLSLKDGAFAVYQKLPRLPVSRGNDTTRRGSLSVHSPVDLMRYCEEAGLMGRLLLERKGRLAIAYYDRGELSDVSIDDGSPEDFVEALDWAEGTFRIDATPPPRDTIPPVLQDALAEHANPTAFHAPTPETAEPGSSPLLRAVEVGLLDNDDATGKWRNDPTGPREAELVHSESRVTTVSRDRTSYAARVVQEDATMRIIRRQGGPAPETPWDLRSRMRQRIPAPAPGSESATTARVAKDDGRAIGFRVTALWVVAVAGVILACLWVLSILPPLE